MEKRCARLTCAFFEECEDIRDGYIFAKVRVVERSAFAWIVADGWEGVNGRVLEDVFGRMDDLILCVGSWSEEKMFHSYNDMLESVCKNHIQIFFFWYFILR